MQALRVQNFDENPVLLDMPALVISPRSVLVEIRACGLNFADLLSIRGTYQETPPLPFTLGMELSGIVREIGADVSEFSPGDRVAAFAGQGGLAQQGVFDADRCVKLPDAIDDVTAASLLIAYGTSHLALTQRAKLLKGETLLVLGAAGGVGLTAVEIGHALGARVIACARGAQKLKVAEAAGADILIDTEKDDLRKIVKDAGGADAVYDPVGGDLFKAALRSCKPEARYLTIGFASGDVPQIPANILLVKNITVHGFYWGGVFNYAPDVFRASLDDVFAMVAGGRLSPQVRHTYPLENALEGLELLRQRKSTGKVVITIPTLA